MQIDKITPDEAPAATDRRSRAPHEDGRDQRSGSDPVQRTLDGGVTRPPVLDRTHDDPAHEARQHDRDTRRRRAMALVAEYTRLPTDAELDLDVDVTADQVTFLIRDRRTGELMRSIPEGEAQALLDKLREFSGTLVDRSL